MTSAEAIVLGAAIAGAVGLVTALLTRRSEHEKWLREKRLDAYTSFLSAVEAVITRNPTRVEIERLITESIADAREALREGYIQGELWTMEGHRRFMYGFVEPFEHLERSMALVDMVGPDDLHEPVHTLRKLAFDVGIGKRDDEAGRNEVNEAYGQFVRKARHHLRAQGR